MKTEWGAHSSIMQLLGHSFETKLFQRGVGVYFICQEFQKGSGVKKKPQKWKIPGGGGSYVKFPLWWGMDIFWNHTFPLPVLPVCETFDRNF